MNTHNVSPYVAEAAARCRAPVALSPIGRMYLIEVGHRDGSYFAESDHLPRGKDLGRKDALAAVRQEDNAVAVWELNPSEGSMRDISEDLAIAWLQELIRDGFNPEEDMELPQFIEAHVSHQQAVALFTENYPTLEAVI